jgi:hypothetical protein
METLRHDGFQVGGTTIGPFSVPCPGCGVYIILTGRSEWDDKTFMQRLWFILNRTIWMAVSSLVIAGGFALIATYFASEHWFMNRVQVQQCRWRMYWFATALITIQFFRIAMQEIRDSQQRTRDVEFGSSSHN